MGPSVDLSDTDAVRREFNINYDKFSTINASSYGCTPKDVLRFWSDVQFEVEELPDHFFRRTAEPKFLECYKLLAPQLGRATNYKDLVFVPNSTAAINIVMRSFGQWHQGDVIVITNLTYQSFRSTVEEITRRHNETDVEGDKKKPCPITVLQIDLKLPLQDVEKDFVQPFETQLVDKLAELKKANPSTNFRLKFACIDFITSMSSIVLPVKDLTSVLKKHQCEVVMIDAAHTVGQLPPGFIDVASYGADIYVSNLHKWFWSPKTSAVMWVTPKLHDFVQRPIIAQNPPYYPDPQHPGITPSEDDRSALHRNFIWQGTLGTSHHLCTKASLAFFEKLGGQQKVWDHNTALATKVTAMIATKMPDMKPLPLAERFQAPMLRNFIIPSRLVKLLSDERRKRYEQNGEYVQHDYFRRYKTQIMMGFQPKSLGLEYPDNLVVRLTFQVFNKLEEYEKFIDSLEEFFSKE